jgi:hypothetical protein
VWQKFTSKNRKPYVKAAKAKKNEIKAKRESSDKICVKNVKVKIKKFATKG